MTPWGPGHGDIRSRTRWDVPRVSIPLWAEGTVALPILPSTPVPPLGQQGDSKGALGVAHPHWHRHVGQGCARDMQSQAL